MGTLRYEDDQLKMVDILLYKQHETNRMALTLINRGVVRYSLQLSETFRAHIAIFGVQVVNENYEVSRYQMCINKP